MDSGREIVENEIWRHEEPEQEKKELSLRLVLGEPTEEICPKAFKRCRVTVGIIIPG
ncbi:MAG: hypothetical protein PHV74_03725 [Dehalococcoidia bacterium]|nr:hypothetical protein [Dehalococcoidia bacterium]